MAADGAGAAGFDARVSARLVLRMLIQLCLLLLIAGSLSYWAREPCEAFARSFWANLGYWGVGLGTLLADGLHFPVPPQFYMLLAVASGAALVPTFAAIALSSVVAGAVGYELARRVGALPWMRRRTRSFRAQLCGAYERFGYRSAVVASLLPVPYSVLCYLAGLNRLPWRFFVVLALCRVPKLLGFFYLVLLGWRMS